MKSVTHSWIIATNQTDDDEEDELYLTIHKVIRVPPPGYGMEPFPTPLTANTQTSILNADL